MASLAKAKAKLRSFHRVKSVLEAKVRLRNTHFDIKNTTVTILNDVFFFLIRSGYKK